MRLRCPNCDTELDVHDTAILGRKRMVRCAACEQTFRPHPEATESPQQGDSWEVEISNGTLLICSTREELARWIEKDVVKASDKARRHHGDWETVDDILHQTEPAAPSFPGPAAHSPPNARATNHDEEPSGSFQREERETIVSSIHQGIENRRNASVPNHSSNTPRTSSAGSSILMMVLVAVCAGVVGWWAGHVGLFIPEPIVPNESWKHSAGIPPVLNKEPPPTTIANGTDIISAPETPIEAPDITPETPDSVSVKEQPIDDSSLPPEEDIVEETGTTEASTLENAPEKELPKTESTDSAEEDASSEVSAGEKTATTPNKKKMPRSPEPKSYDFWMEAGNGARESGQYQEAINAYQKAAQLSPSVEPLVRVAKVFMKQKKYGLATKTLRESLDRSTAFPWIYFGLGQALEKEGRKKEALRYYREYLQRFPEGSLNVEARKAVEKLRR